MTSPPEGHRHVRLRRLIEIYDLLLFTASPISAVRLSTRLGVSRRTIFRDMKILKDAGLPIEHDRTQDGYYLIARDKRVAL